MRFQGLPRAQSWFCCPQVPWLSFPSLFFSPSFLPCTAHLFPNTSRGSWGRGLLPLPAPSAPSQAQAGWWQGGTSFWAGQRSQETPTVRKAPQGSPPPPSALPGAPSILEVALFVSCATALSPRSPRAMPSQHPAATAAEPRAPLVSPGMLALATLTSFPSPFLPWGSTAGCFPCAAAEPAGGHVPAVPAVPGPGVPAGAGASSARVSSPALLQPSAKGRENGGRGEGGGEGGNETLIAQSPFCFPAYGIFHTC